MTTLNKELFAKDPTQTKIPNDGVAKVVRPETEHQWEVLEWELKSFVCEGEYERGLERILGSFLTNLSQSQQPAVWVSGFYGSGKSHLCRVLEYLWRDVKLPSGETARSLVHLPSEIDAHFRELSIAGKRLGGLWSAAGTLGAGRSQAVRLAFLSVLFDSGRTAAAVPAGSLHALGSGERLPRRGRRGRRGGWEALRRRDPQPLRLPDHREGAPRSGSDTWRLGQGRTAPAPEPVPGPHGGHHRRRDVRIDGGRASPEVEQGRPLSADACRAGRDAAVHGR